VFRLQGLLHIPPMLHPRHRSPRSACGRVDPCSLIRVSVLRHQKQNELFFTIKVKNDRYSGVTHAGSRFHFNSLR
jgi:hypothetical protein